MENVKKKNYLTTFKLNAHAEWHVKMSNSSKLS